MIKNSFELDENNLLEIPPLVRLTVGNFANPRFSEMDEENNLLEIPELPINRWMVSDTPEIASQTAYIEPSAESQFEETEITRTQSESGNEAIYPPPAAPDSLADTARRSGLAYGAAITLFGSVVALLILGWIADWLLGTTSPWGIVLGIVIGSAIGFFQFFRITSQIFKSKK